MERGCREGGGDEKNFLLLLNTLGEGAEGHQSDLPSYLGGGWLHLLKEEAG